MQKKILQYIYLKCVCLLCEREHRINSQHRTQNKFSTFISLLRLENPTAHQALVLHLLPSLIQQETGFLLLTFLALQF